MRRQTFFLLALIAIIVIAIAIGILRSFGQTDRMNTEEKEGSTIKVISSIYPYDDFASIIGGDDVDVSLLLPPGADAHHFDPSPQDLIALENADIVFYTSDVMEPWMEQIRETINGPTFVSLVEMDEFHLSDEEDHEHEEESEDHEEGHEDDHDHMGVDPHIWLDFEMAQVIAGRISNILTETHPESADSFSAETEELIADLDALDQRYGEVLENCENRVLIQGGHRSLGYLADRYHIPYYAPVGVHEDAEPTPNDIAEVIEVMRETGVQAVYHDILNASTYAKAISNETGASIYQIYTAHNVKKSDIEQHRHFIEIMEWNLMQLKEGLVCR